MIQVEKFKRIPNKLKREAFSLEIVQRLAKIVHNKRIQKHKNSLPKLSPQDFFIVESLLKEGIFVSSLEALSIPSTSLLWASTHDLLANSVLKETLINVPLEQLMQYPEIILWGLEERLLNIIENYLALPVLYHEPLLKKEIANGKKVDVRQWHFDIEDRAMIKIIIYLNDVNEGGGNFEYISKPTSLFIPRKYKISGGFILDEIVKTFVPVSEWTPCLGQAGTVIFADTSNILHRLQPPLTSDRFSITFSYTSRYPIKIYNKSFFSKNELTLLSSRLSKRQRECLLVK